MKNTGAWIQWVNKFNEYNPNVSVPAFLERTDPWDYILDAFLWEDEAPHWRQICELWWSIMEITEYD
jgi:hypothetical protein